MTEEIRALEGTLEFLKDRIAFSLIVINLRLEEEISERPNKLNLLFAWLDEYSLGKLVGLSERN